MDTENELLNEALMNAIINNDKFLELYEISQKAIVPPKSDITITLPIFPDRSKNEAI